VLLPLLLLLLLRLLLGEQHPQQQRPENNLQHAMQSTQGNSSTVTTLASLRNIAFLFQLPSYYTQGAVDVAPAACSAGITALKYNRFTGNARAPCMVEVTKTISSV